MSTLAQEVGRLVHECSKLLTHPEVAAAHAMPGGTYFLKSGEILALPRDSGDSRYPYGRDGFNFWACASGYMYCNEGLFSLFLRAGEGQEPAIGFFLGLPAAAVPFIPVPLLAVPRADDPDGMEVRRFTVFTPVAAYYITECGPLRFAIRVFVTPTKEIAFSIHMENSGPVRHFNLSSFLNPYLRHQIYESGEDRWFKEIRSLPPSPAQGGLGSFLVLVNEDKDRHHSITNHGVTRRGWSCGPRSRLVSHEETTSRYQYVGGARGSLHAAAALSAGTFGKSRPVTTFTETAIAGDILSVELGEKDSARLDIIFSVARDAGAAAATAAAAIAPASLDADVDALLARETEVQAGLRVHMGDSNDARLKPAVFNAFFQHLKKQVEFCSLIKGYIQLSENSLIGVRDVFQALEGFLFWQPAAAKAKMMEALGFTAPDGRCFRQYSLPSANGDAGRMDLRPFIDQGAWVISCVSTYLKFTGDLAFLREMCGYHEIVDEAARKVVKSKREDSVLEHLVKITDFLVRNRDPETQCVLALYGDWNDALDGLGISGDISKAYGTGVSVMATLQVVQNLREMIEILEVVNRERFAGQIAAYRNAGQEIEQGLRKYAVVESAQLGKRIVHGWGDKRSYLVGGFKDPDGTARDGLTSNAFWVLAGLCEKDPSLRDAILDAFNRLDSKYGFKTFEPFFPPDTPGVGRIGKLPPGTAENGAAYVHATVFAIMALFRMGRPREAWEQLVKVLPFTDLHGNLSHSPFVMPNSYGLNPDKFIDGQNMNDWQTGSSNVLLKLLIRHVFGYEPLLGGVWIQPAGWLPFKQFEFDIRARGCDVRVMLDNKGAGRRSFAVNGRPRDGVLDEAMGISRLWIPYEEFKAGALHVLVTE